MKILLALGADLDLCLIGAALTVQGWVVIRDPAGIDVEQLVAVGMFDAVLIGDAAPDDAPRLLARLRSAAPDIALMVVAGAADLAAKARLFDAGADDVLSPAVEAGEIGLRAGAIARRRHGHRERAIRFGDLAVMTGDHATVRGRPVALTRAEFAVLEFLALRAGRVLGREALLSALYTDPDMPSRFAVDVRICNLRRKLATFGLPANLIGTVHGSGWMMAPPHPPGAALPSYRAEVKRLRREAAAEARP